VRSASGHGRTRKSTPSIRVFAAIGRKISNRAFGSPTLAGNGLVMREGGVYIADRRDVEVHGGVNLRLVLTR